MPVFDIGAQPKVLPVEGSWIDEAMLDECIDEWLPDFIAALERPGHIDSDALLLQATTRVRESFQDTYADYVGEAHPGDIDAGELLVAQEQTIQMLYGCARWIVAERSR